MSRIKSLYPFAQEWQKQGNIYIISDTHFGDADRGCMPFLKDYTEDEQIQFIKDNIKPRDTLIHLGDVGNPEYLKQLDSRIYKVLVMGNHDESIEKYKSYFDEIYKGAVFISPKILLSHEPVIGLDWCLNIHGHVHQYFPDTLNHINVCPTLNVHGIPLNLNDLVNEKGVLKKVIDLHRQTIDYAIVKKGLKR